MISPASKTAMVRAVTLTSTDKRNTFWKFLTPEQLNLALVDNQNRIAAAKKELVYLLTSSDTAGEELTESIKYQSLLIQYYQTETETIQQLLKEITHV